MGAPIAARNDGIAGDVAGDSIPAGTQVIELRLAQLRQMFNFMDPSPFLNRDLDPKAEEFIVEWCRELPRDAPLALLVYLERAPGMAEEADALRTAVRNYFEGRSEATRRRLRQLFGRGRMSLLIGIGFLVLAVIASQLMMRALEAGSFAEILNQSLIIGGWVAMWRPLEIFLYDWWPLKADRDRFNRLAAMPVQIRYVPGGNAQSATLDWPFTEAQHAATVRRAVAG